MPLKIMSLTDAAAERVREIMEDSETPVTGVRVGIKNAGCAGQAYTLDYVAEPTKGDDHIEDKGVHVWIEPKATLFLLGTVMPRGYPGNRFSYASLSLGMPSTGSTPPGSRSKVQLSSSCVGPHNPSEIASSSPSSRRTMMARLAHGQARAATSR